MSSLIIPTVQGLLALVCLVAVIAWMEIIPDLIIFIMQYTSSAADIAQVQAARAAGAVS